MSDKIKVGIIGCGGIANGKHMPSLKQLNNIEIVAFCDIIKEKAEDAAKKIWCTRCKSLYRLSGTFKG